MKGIKYVYRDIKLILYHDREHGTIKVFILSVLRLQDPLYFYCCQILQFQNHQHSKYNKNEHVRMTG
jgi:hypothetical protein